MAQIGAQEWLALLRVLASRRLTRFGDTPGELDHFEAKLCGQFDVPHALTVNSGTSALICALAAAGIGPGDEVIVPAYTWVSTAAAPIHLGAVPIFAEINDTLTIDPADIERRITPWTRAIVPVHMINTPCDMEAILRIARRHRLLVIEDACQAVGVRYRDRRCGAMGDLGAFSFNQFKNITSGEGGAVLAKDARLFERARNYHDVGAFIRGHQPLTDEPAFVGQNYRVSELVGAMLSVQIGRLEKSMIRLAHRRRLASTALEDLPGLTIAPHNDPAQAVSLCVQTDSRRARQALEDTPGIYPLSDNSKHIYTNWTPILNQVTVHPGLNPWARAHREIVYSADMCPRTLSILERTYRIDLSTRLPTPLLVRRMKTLASALRGHEAGGAKERWATAGQARPLS
jgi:dTDP-4-amino-4,6-dideoxygalactose transaminase